MIEIDKDIPMPEIKKGRTLKYPWYELKVTNSFLIMNRTRGSVSSLVTYHNKHDSPREYQYTKEKGTSSSYRVWRVQ